MAALRILDVDCENRPLTYLGSGWTTGDLTAIAWSWNGRTVTSVVLGEKDTRQMLAMFIQAYDQADVVTGHYLRGYDLPVINGQVIEAGWQPLDQKLVVDTKLDLYDTKYQSLSQENLCAMLGCPIEKVHVTQAEWREANRLTRRGIALTRRRVETDVRQHWWLREKLAELGWLKTPQVWDGTKKASRYRP